MSRETISCVFCRIANGDAPAAIVYQDDLVTAFRDLKPVAPTHILIIPNAHIESVGALSVSSEEGSSERNPPNLSAEQTAVMGRIFAVAVRLADSEGLSRGGFRLVANTGQDGGQSVDHLHWHLLGGRRLGWPPG